MTESWGTLLVPAAIALSLGAQIWNTKDGRPAWRTKLYLGLLTAFCLIGYSIERERQQESNGRSEQMRDLSNRIKSWSPQPPPR
jgi:hypothetical protein